MRAFARFQDDRLQLNRKALCRNKISMSLKSDAEALRLALLTGLVDTPAVVAWADRLILADRIAEAPAVLDLSLAGSRPPAEIVALLGQVPGAPDHASVGRRVAARLRRALESGELDVVAVARGMYRMLREGYAPDSDFEGMAYFADDGVDLALARTYGTLDDIREELTAFLARYQETEVAIAPPAA